MALTCTLTACGPQGERPLQGYVEGEYVRVAAPFAGALQQLAVTRGEQVAVGAPLFSLESENEVAARRQAEQQLQSAEARLANLKTGKRPPEVATVAEQLQQALAARELSAANLKRQESLAKSGFISGAALDDARTQLKRDDAAVAQLQASVATAKLPATSRRDPRGRGRCGSGARCAGAGRLAARAARHRRAGRRARQRHVLRHRRLGAGGQSRRQSAARGQREDPLLRTRADRSAGSSRGKSLTFACDGCGAPMPATITFISDRAEFTPPVLYSKENRAKLVYLVEARPAAEVAARLNPGQPVDVTLTQ